MDGLPVRTDVPSTARLMQEMVAVELHRLATTSGTSTGRRLRILMRMLDRVRLDHHDGPGQDGDEDVAADVAHR